MYQSPQHFCTNCGQPLATGATFCVSCGTQAGAASTPALSPFQTGVAPGSPPSYAQATNQADDDLLLAGLLVGSGARRRERRLRRQDRRSRRTPGARLRGCGCIVLLMVLLIGPFVAAALTTGVPHQIFSLAAGGMVLLLVLFLLIGMLATRSGREALTEGLFEALFEGLFGGR